MPPLKAFSSGGLAISHPLATRLTFPGLVAVGVVVETDLTVVLVQAGCLTVGPPLAARGAAALVARPDLSAGMIAGDCTYGGLVISVDVGDCADSSTAV